METATREVFGNIAPWMKALFYAMILASLGILAWRVAWRFRMYAAGRPGGMEKDPLLWLARLWTHAVRQKRVTRRAFAGVMHLLVFSGFVVLTIGTTLLFIADSGPVNFHHGWYYLGYELTMDVFGVALSAGCCMAIYRRLAARPASLGHNLSDWWVLGSLLALGVTGFMIEALRLHYTRVPSEHARWSIVATAIQSLLLRPMDTSTAQKLHLATWWIHAVLVAAFFATLPVTRMLHAITGPVNIAGRPRRAMGALEPVSIEEVEQTGRVGVQQIEDFDFQQRLSLDACMQCGRCHDACPAQASGKPLSPMHVVNDLRRHMYERQGAGGRGQGEIRPLHGETILAETLWACTMCQACVYECPVLIGQVDLISGMRRYLVGEGRIDGPPAAAMRHITAYANPYGVPNDKRLDWAQGLDVPVATPNGEFEYLLWVGCAASFDPRAQRVARAVVQLLQQAGVRFAVLGRAERCTGDPARRLGDEFLFQEAVQHNIDLLNRHQVRKVITPCPHCANTLGNEYSQFGGQYEVVHHSQLLAELVRQGRLRAAEVDGSFTLHDPCYLARALGETAAQREVLGARAMNETSAKRKADGSEFRELPRCGDRTFCCGAGGGRMWFDERPEERVSHIRAREVVASQARTLATACPFCLNMMTDGLAGIEGGGQVQVLDIAELLVASQSASNSPGGTP
jgi:Fe-S oxidoreductase/nitrate reductase gamma subunit